MFRAVATVTLRPSILDPQGKAVQHALGELGHGAIRDVRVGKHVELAIEADSLQEAERIARAACEGLLANPVVENFSVQVKEGAQSSSHAAV